MVHKSLSISLLLLLSAWMAGCHENVGSQTILFLDGAGNYTASGSVEDGLREAGYTGSFQTHYWSSFLGWGADHFVMARLNTQGEKLAEKIVEYKRQYPYGQLSLIGLSAGTSVIISALEQLPYGVQVDYVVLLSSSASGRHDLRRVMEHVHYRLYATVSPRDLILRSIPINADGQAGLPAGYDGFHCPVGLKREERKAYERVINLQLRPGYAAWGWTGGHVQATTPAFIRTVIAPRIMSSEPFPLDRPVVRRPNS